ncbi:MAG: diguanylate cyclase [Arenimonas sp.]|uniref:diguanylate cyclase domain-containing protein n=1 Tax=Arenimonas sp. TaxID=1872635 RepID=UPI0025C5804D|nr:diguanylate cyclase [Arenimonas sp.]MBW8366615.1 diguanylate cyclase [Arenimonas sp.]
MSNTSQLRNPSAPASAIGTAVHADDLRTALAEFRQSLGSVPQDYQAMTQAEREAAFLRLSMAAEEAARIAERAVRGLDELAVATQRDPLTDTPNRTVMLDRMGTAMAMARRRKSRLAVMFLDLDHFKQVNDTHGHARGDELLKLVARRLESAVRDTDTVSRFGGDEFLVLLSEISEVEDAGLIAAKILQTLAEPHLLADCASGVRASIGISLFPEDGSEVPDLLESADQAMYRAKKLPGSSYQFHSVPTTTDTRALDEVKSAENDQTLRQANERLVLKVLAKHPADPESEAVHGRRVRFLAMVAHELRHPLAPIRSVAELIQRAARDEDQLTRMRHVIDSQVFHMARLVDDLLDDSPTVAGRFRMEREPMDLFAALRRVTQAWEPALALKNQKLHLRIPRRECLVDGDPTRIAQAFANLLDNASRYTPEGGQIRILARRSGGGICVRVSDNGIGMPKGTLDCIFDLFSRGTQAMAVHKGGLGIGLAVARELLEAHGGSVSAKSAGEGHGSQFDVLLPELPCAVPIKS